MPRLKAALVLLSVATAFAPAALWSQAAYSAVPGSLNFAQGEVNIDGQPLPSSVNGNAEAASAPKRLAPGQTLATAHGSADILLAPGALLRLGDDTTVQMVSADQNRTEVRLEQGRANVSVNLVRKDHLLLVDLQNGQTQLRSGGLYTFNAASETMQVFHGEALVFRGADTSSDVKPVTVKEGHEILLGGDKAKAEKFDRELADDDLLPWNGPREAQSVLADNSLPHDGSGLAWSSGNGGYAGSYPGAYGFAGPYAYGGPYGWGDPYAWGPYGFGGYPFFGVGFGFWGGGFYGGGVHGYPPGRLPGIFGGHAPGTALRGGTVRGGGFAGGRGFGGGGHIGGGGGHR